MIKHVRIDIIPHEKQRYPTAGDWQYFNDGKALEIRVSDTGNYKEALAVAVHELVEAVLAVERGISEEEITKFDIDWENGVRTCDNYCPCRREQEPGACYNSPYMNEHYAATQVEIQLVRQWALDWEKYNNNLWNLTENGK